MTFWVSNQPCWLQRSYGFLISRMRYLKYGRNGSWTHAHSLRILFKLSTILYSCHRKKSGPEYTLISKAMIPFIQQWGLEWCIRLELQTRKIRLLLEMTSTHEVIRYLLFLQGRRSASHIKICGASYYISALLRLSIEVKFAPISWYELKNQCGGAQNDEAGWSTKKGFPHFQNISASLGLNDLGHFPHISFTFFWWKAIRKNL